MLPPVSRAGFIVGKYLVQAGQFPAFDQHQIAMLCVNVQRLVSCLAQGADEANNRSEICDD
jgi:hypothetical protein